jgi:hypothetical protein
LGKYFHGGHSYVLFLKDIQKGGINQFSTPSQSREEDFDDGHYIHPHISIPFLISSLYFSFKLTGANTFTLPQYSTAIATTQVGI